MAAKRPAPPPLSYVLRTARCRSDYKGGHAEGLELLFVALPDALARRKMLDRLERAHAKMLARESEPEEAPAEVAGRPLCTVCRGSGSVSTGIDEAPTTMCVPCDGSGWRP